MREAFDPATVRIFSDAQSHPHHEYQDLRQFAGAGSAQIHGVFQHSFQDLGGHLWELIYMDPSFVKR
jgi:hypothetical protein